MYWIFCKIRWKIHWGDIIIDGMFVVDRKITTQIFFFGEIIFSFSVCMFSWFFKNLFIFFSWYFLFVCICSLKRERTRKKEGFVFFLFFYTHTIENSRNYMLSTYIYKFMFINFLDNVVLWCKKQEKKK